MAFHLSKKSYRKLEGVNPQLVETVEKAIKLTKVDFGVIYGVRTLDEQKKLYEQMRKEALATLNGKTVTTMTALTQLMRLHQITCGHFTADDGSIQTIKNNRMSELTDLLDEVEGKAVIWAHYQYDVNEIVKAITKEYGEDSVVTYYGLTPQEERQDNIKRFQEDDKCRFLVGTPQTGGYGITLTAASTMIYLSLIHI